MKELHKNQLLKLAEESLNIVVDKIQDLPQSGSYREYYRFFHQQGTVLGVFNDDVEENEAFFSFTHSFLKHQILVPGILKISADRKFYFLEDIGDTTLYEFLKSHNKAGVFSAETLYYYQQSLIQLAKLQVVASMAMDYSVCYPSKSFDTQSMMWDLNYFKYHFLKTARIPFHEQRLEDDFIKLVNYLSEAGTEYFLYRDFQSRNIMIHNSEVYFIDYQGGRKGALQYDVASLLFDAKAVMPDHVRKQLLDFYFAQLQGLCKVNKDSFYEYFTGFALIRVLQAMAAYGFRGLIEKKRHFIESIPFGIRNIQYLLQNYNLPFEMPELQKTLQKLCESDHVQDVIRQYTVLNIRINSFSFRRGVPYNDSGDGSGFVFDCRLLHNPGRYDEYKQFCGKDSNVQAFFAREQEVEVFLENIFAIADQAILKYKQRKHNHITFNFGCTGGQHRSVFCAERLAKHIKERFDCNIMLRHLELEKVNLKSNS